MKKAVLSIGFALLLGLTTTMGWAETVTINVKRNGFFTETGWHINPSRPLIIPAGEIVTLRFQWNEKAGTIAYGDTHRIDIRNRTTGEVYETTEIWWFNQTAFIAISSGEPGTIHHGYCMSDCLGMSQLGNLIIQSK